jgi:hypothetical protein
MAWGVILVYVLSKGFAILTKLIRNLILDIAESVYSFTLEAKNIYFYVHMTSMHNYFWKIE